MPSEIVVGIDVGKRGLDANLYAQRAVLHFSNDGEGRGKLVKWLQGNGSPKVVMEATGGYERPVAQALWAVGIAVAIVNPMRVRQFAKSQGILAKTDKIDAGVIAHFGSVTQPGANLPQTEAEAYLSACVERRRQLVTNCPVIMKVGRGAGFDCRWAVQLKDAVAPKTHQSG